jgi:hypothetical protein
MALCAIVPVTLRELPIMVIGMAIGACVVGHFQDRGMVCVLFVTEAAFDLRMPAGEPECRQGMVKFTALLPPFRGMARSARLP